MFDGLHLAGDVETVDLLNVFLHFRVMMLDVGGDFVGGAKHVGKHHQHALFRRYRFQLLAFAPSAAEQNPNHNSNGDAG